MIIYVKDWAVLKLYRGIVRESYAGDCRAAVVGPWRGIGSYFTRCWSLVDTASTSSLVEANFPRCVPKGTQTGSSPLKR